MIPSPGRITLARSITGAIMTDEKCLDVILRTARTHNAFMDRPVSDATLRQAHELMKWGPTSALVGPHFISSCACLSVASLTGRSMKTLWVRAVRRITSRHFSSVIIAPVIDLASVIRPGDGIICGQACAEPQTLMGALVAQRAAFSGAGLFLGVNYAGIVQPGHADYLRLSAYCGIGHNRALADAGALEIQPAPYSRLGALIRSGAIRADVVLVQVSPPNGRGEYSL